MDAFTKELMEDRTLDAAKKFVAGKLNQQNKKVNEALAEFECMIDQCAPPMVWVETLYWTIDDWLDWLMGR